MHRYNHSMKLWVGVSINNGKLDCDEPEDCLTKCYAKPANKEECKNEVYLQCG